MSALTFVSYTEKWHNAPYDFISPSRKELSAYGKHVVVTGGGTGIGKATAIAFAKAGASVVSILGRRTSRLQSAADEIRAVASNPNVKVLHVSTDLTDRSSVDAALKTFVDQAGGAKIDVFVSNAAASSTYAPASEYPLKAFRDGLEGNVVATLNGLQAFIPFAAPGAKVVNVSSGMGHMAPLPGGMLSYSVNKAAVIKMFEYFATENPSLHVVQIQPGVIETEMSSGGGVKAQDDVNLPGEFTVWLTSEEGSFLRNKYVWANWDAEELIAKKKQIQESKDLEVYLGGVPM